MPAIRKVRIVNFRFNDGTKLIPDEIFCTENAEGKPLDTLLNLENGGGKSVIVQLLLQPVCPKAKVQNRSISEYFQKGTDHAFILIEWALDGSSNSLLTGIAIAASTTADDEEESKTVRYYTFMHDYSRTGDKLDLINLHLTEKKGNHIRPLSFDELRKYLQTRKVEYYPSDSLRRYHKRLEEYGILHTEWENILVRINEVEGGIGNFFEEYKTADKLLDRFIIPGVMPNDIASSEELEDMFLNYANSYAGQEENLRLQSGITAFTEKLKGILPLMKDMWNAEDERLQSIRHLADHLFTIENQIKLHTSKMQELEGTVSSLKEKLHHINAEKASEAYYIAKEEHDKAKQLLEECEIKKEEAETQLKNFSHTVDVLNAAKEYSELTELRNEHTALSAQLRELDQGTQDTHILSLKYSLAEAAKSLNNAADEDLKKEENTKNSHTNSHVETLDRITELSKQNTEKNNSLNRLKGTKDCLQDQIKTGLESLNLQITVMLDGRYSSDDIANANAAYDKQIKLACEKTEEYQDEENSINQELKEQDAQRNELILSQAETTVKLNQFEEELLKYRNAYEATIPVLAHLSVPAERIFTDEPLTCLDRLLKDLKEQLRRSERSAETLSEQVRCIESGQLHLAKSAVEFLQETGISFQTGEQYLNCHPAKVKDTILSVNPLAAYAVVVDSEKEKEKLMSYPADSWLPSVVPVYTLSELADMAEGKWNRDNSFLSSFDKEYFDDVSSYTEQIRKKLDDTNNETDNLRNQITDWESERDILLRFDYTSDYEQNLQKQIDNCNEKLSSIHNSLTDLDNRKAEIHKRIEELGKLKEEQQEIIRNIENNKKEFKRICGIISDYEAHCTIIAETEAECRELYSQLQAAQEEEKRLSALIKECEIHISQLVKNIAEYIALLEELKDTPDAEPLTDEYSVMLAEYRLYQENYSSDFKRLQEQLKKNQDKIHKQENSIKRFHLDISEYENITYSDEAFDHAREQQDQAKQNSELASAQHTKAVNRNAKAESAMEQAENKLTELHTDLLDRSEVGSDFERRLSECKSELAAAEESLNKCNRLISDLGAEQKTSAKYVTRYEADLAKYTPKATEDIQDAIKLQDKIEDAIGILNRAENKTKVYHQRELEPFRDTHNIFTGTLDGIISVIDNKNIAGDKYFTLYERTEDDIRRYSDRIEQLSVMLKDVEDSRKQLVTNCRQRVGRLYENLNILSKKSAIQIGDVRRQMIRIELPEIDLTSEQPSERINEYITEQVRKYLSDQESSKKSHHDHLEIRRLLNCLIGKDTIPITVFKIDKTIQNSRYRSWQEALKANSGGEQFVVFFTLIVSIMNYTRSLSGNLNHTTGVLILDNPFGPITSQHLLEPMFRIAKHFHIQLICLTHIGTQAVKSSFEIVYQLRFKNLALSNIQILESELEQHMEHAFYRSEQLSLFD